MTEFYTPKKFTYPNLKSISKDAFDLHLKLYEGYVAKLNEILTKYETVDKNQANHNYSQIRSLLVDKSFNYNAMILHEAFFEALNPEPPTPTDEIIGYAKEFFGNFENYIDDLKAVCMASRVGWGISVFSNNKLQNFAIDRHDLHVPIDGDIVIAIDTWEHAFLLDYGIDKKTYLDAVFKEIDFNIMFEINS